MSSTIDWDRVVSLWRASGRSRGTVVIYLQAARRFVEHCRRRRRDPIAHLTRDRVRRAAREYSRRRRARGDPARPACIAARALSCALTALGRAVPQWSTPRQAPAYGPLVTRFLEHRKRYRGVVTKTLHREGQCATTFTTFLSRRGRRVRGVRVVDVDAFVGSMAERYKAKTVAGLCSALRAFLRYLHVAGLATTDLSALVVAPRVRAVDRPPRAVPWNDVRRIVRAIDPAAPLGLRDKALFLLMAAYGMGASEVTNLRLDEIDWRARQIHLRRPKTGVVTVLPLLDPVARALAEYLRRGRPAHAAARTVFVSDQIPHERLTGSTVIRHRLEIYARRAGVRSAYLGTHLFRHSHATRQIEQGQRPKIVGDILGHRRPESTSVYARSAVHRLRSVGLPVPR
jgi:integrase/recombinase XerD